MKKLLGAVALVLCMVGSVVGSVYSVEAGTLPATLTWSNPTDITDGIQVEKSASVTGTFVIVNQTAVNVTTYTDATNAAGDTSCYRIAYFNTSGVGLYAGPVCKTFPTVPTVAPATFGVK